MKEKEIVSLNLCKVELNEEMNLTEQIEKLSSAMQRTITGGVDCSCYTKCRCHYDCPTDGCVDCFCYGMEDMPHCGAFT